MGIFDIAAALKVCVYLEVVSASALSYRAQHTIAGSPPGTCKRNYLSHIFVAMFLTFCLAFLMRILPLSEN